MKEKKGQATVEYTLLIVLISTAVLGLLSFSNYADRTIDNLKSGMVTKLSGEYKLTRKDFFTGKLNTYKGNGSEGQNGAGSGGGGGGAATQGKKPAQTAAQKLPGAEGEEGGAQGAAPTQEIIKPNQENADYETIDNESKRYAKSYNAGAQEEEAAKKMTPAEAEKAEELAAAEEGKNISVVKKKDYYEEMYGRKKTLAEKDWGLGKLIIIILVLIFFFVIIFRAKGSRD